LNSEWGITGEKNMKKRIKKIVVFLVLATVSIVSCKEIFFNGDENTRVLSLEDFHAVEITGIYNIVLVQDSTNRLVITGKNDINSIDAIINNDTLFINDHKKMSLNTERNTIALHFSNIDYMVTYDPVNVTNTGIIKAETFIYLAIGEIVEVRLAVDCNFLYAVVSANTLGYFHLTGKANDCVFFNRYGCSMFADSLTSENAEIVNESIGDVHVNASENIKAFIWGPGNIYYYGTPIIEIAEKRGGGNMIRAD
jgi:hypothetical protein